MGLFSGIKDLLFGTEDDAAKLNAENTKKMLALIMGVPVGAISDQAIAQITGQAEKTIGEGFDKAVGAIGAAGTQANLGASAAGKTALGDARTNLLQRGLGSSSLLTGAQTGIAQQVARTQAGISGNVAGAQGGLLAQRGQAVGAATQQREHLLAQLYSGKRDALLQQGSVGANLLSGVHHEGQPGVLGNLIGDFAGGFGGGVGQWGGKLASSLFGV